MCGNHQTSTSYINYIEIEASLCEDCHSVHLIVGPVPLQSEAPARYGTEPVLLHVGGIAVAC